MYLGNATERTASRLTGMAGRVMGGRATALPWPPARLTYTGALDRWEFAIYRYSGERYDPDEWLFPGAEELDGTIEVAMRAGWPPIPLMGEGSLLAGSKTGTLSKN